MPASSRRVTAQDLIPDAEYAAQRKARRAALLPAKRLRRVELGPYCTLYFESYDTMLFQIQEMLLTEKGGPGQIEGELEAYNPLIPQGREFVATVMFEIDDPVRRAGILGRLGEERTRDGKTSAVHFLRFALTDAMARAFRDPAVTAMVGCDHPFYGHLAVLSPATRAELSTDLA
jgi:hypothetical protein